jgi:phospholipid/cholesterol/gamma-HCH transport system substrate-binding protein
MRSHHHRPGLTGTVVKVVVFTVVSVLITSIVISSLLDVNTQPATGYNADFSNASGLQPGDTVRIAGVEVGKVSAVTLQHNHAEVSFSVDNSQHLTTTSAAAIHFENLLGQRFLAVLPGRSGGNPLPPRGGHPRTPDHAGHRPDGGIRRLPAPVRRTLARPGEPVGGLDHRRLPG